MYTKIKIILVAAIVAVFSIGGTMIVGARSCPDVVSIFARGSGGERWTSQDYLAFRDSLDEKLRTTRLSYEFVDLDYPAVGLDFSVTAGAIISGGEAYQFGESVNKGVAEMARIVNSGCSNTRFVFGGYSQGAMVVIKTLGEVDSDRILYAATFGDPKLYLPEGYGPTPAACYGKNLSNYRMYVPDCFASSGKLGAVKPYQTTEYIDKLGTWCNRHDIMCSPYLSISAHTSYAADDLYEDASRRIFEKITDYYGIENQFFVPHDTAILIDSTGSMAGMIDQYKDEALRLARETLENNGRVALYDYRDLDDPYEPVAHCDFENCTLEKFTQALSIITVDGGGDTPESLLSAAYHVMCELNWKVGHTKSLVVLTDALYLSPDRDGVSFSDVVRLSKIIDPVNIYVITNADVVEYYTDLAAETGGRAVTIDDNLSLLTDQIMARSDSLPRVEEADIFGYGSMATTPELTITKVEDFGDSVKIHFENTGVRVLVSMNDAWLGILTSNEVMVTDLDRTIENRVVLTPLSDIMKGEEKEIIIKQKVPGVPDTGIIK